MANARLFAKAAAVASVALGTIVLLGWTFRSPTMKGAIGVPITMKANTAACFVLGGASLWLCASTFTRRRFVARLLGSVVAIAGGLTLVEHISGWNLGLDEILFSEPAGEVATASPGRMGPPASMSFLFLGLSLLFVDWRTRAGRTPFRYLPLIVMMIALVSLVGYALDSPRLYASARTTGIAWPTAIGLLVLSIGVVAARPDNRIMRILLASNIGGVAARRMLVPAIVVPFVLLLAYSAAREGELIDANLGRGLLAVIMMVALAAIVLITANDLVLSAESQQRVERQLSFNELELSDFFENAAIGMHWIGPDGSILRANRADMQLLGYSGREYLGHNMAEFHVDSAVPADMLRKLHAGLVLRDYPAQLRCKDGSIKSVLIDSSVHWHEGRFVHTRTITRDVSAQWQSEIVARRLSAIVESSDDAIVGKNLEGIVTDWNRAAEKTFGYTAEEMIGQSITRLIPPELHSDEFDLLRRIRMGESVQIYDTVRRRKDGVLINVSLTVSPIRDASGKVVGASKIARDITERKAIEAEREALLESERAARSEAERASTLRDEFLAVVSHELRNPLNSIMGWVHILKKGRKESEVIAEGLDSIERGARAQMQLVKDLLDMNRIMTGKMLLEVASVDLPTLIESTVATIMPAAESKGIKLRTILDTHVTPIMGDATRLQQIVWNLLSNALKFTPRDGSIDIVLKRRNSQVEFCISDSGIGIKPDFLPFVFERFRQADSSTTRSYGGLGLGLSIVKHLTELHGGTVAAESEGEGRGATFVVTLPVAAVRHRQDAFTDANSVSDSREVDAVDLVGVRVLVVDDDAEARGLVKRVLEHYGADVTTAGSAQQGLELLKTQEIDLLLSDIGMPQMDGYQFIRKVRHTLSDRTSMLPAIALTAYARSEDRTQAMLAGYQMHIAKPIEPRELVATVASFAGRTQLQG